MVVRKTYQVDPKYAGLVIGKQGKDLRALKGMPGVNNIYFDTRSSTHTYSLQVTGASYSVCEAVYDEIKRRIKVFSMVIPDVARTFIDVPDRSLDVIQLVPFGVNRSESVVVGERGHRSSEKYIISSFTKGDLHDTFDLEIGQGNSNTKPDFMEFLEKNISLSFQEALTNHKGVSNELLKFHMSPGKIIYISQGIGGRPRLLRSKITGTNGTEYLKQQKIRTFFTPNLNPKYIELVNKRLADLGFENLNEDCPETYTTVHLNVGSEQIPFSVVLALDQNLETPKESSDDPRLSSEKQKAIKRILDARTISEVMDVTDSVKLKMKYYKLTLNVHPDKNLLPGATEAFKKLNDAYEKMAGGKSFSTKALVVENKIATESATKAPPKVVRVRTKKIRMCVITTMSAKDLDIRGSLVGYQEDKEKLSDHVREALNLCWDQRDASGRIPTPEGKEKISIRCIKQVLEAHNWAKEVPFLCGTDESAVLEVKIKKLREKSDGDNNWNDCVEIDFKLSDESVNRKQLSAEILAKEMMEIKTWVDRIFQ